MLSLQVYANDSFTYSSNVALDDTLSWTALTHCTNLDKRSIIISNTDVGFLPTTLSRIITLTPNSTNFTYTISANSLQTSSLFINTTDPSERVVIIQTKFISNTGTSFNANNIYLHIKCNLVGDYSNNAWVSSNNAVSLENTLNTLPIYNGTGPIPVPTGGWYISNGKLTQAQ